MSPTIDTEAIIAAAVGIRQAQDALVAAEADLATAQERRDAAARAVEAMRAKLGELVGAKPEAARTPRGRPPRRLRLLPSGVFSVKDAALAVYGSDLPVNRNLAANLLCRMKFAGRVDHLGVNRWRVREPS